MIFGLGTIINTGAVLAGSLIGLLSKRGLKSSVQDSMIKTLGVSTIFISIAGALTGLLKVEAGELHTRGSLLMILSLVIGTLIGELINIDAGISRLGEWLQRRAKADKNPQFVEGFATSSIIICVGAMAIVGSIQDGMTGDYTMLLTKSLLDFVLVMMLSSVFGIGVLFSALPLFVYQGLLTVLAGAIAPWFTPTIIADLSYVGSVLIFGVGLNLLFKNTLKVANMLPALVVVCLLSPLLH